MRIGVVSDTHMPRMARTLPPALRDGLAGVDLILHAGDWVTLEAAKLLEELAPLAGVAGNNDDRVVQRRFPERTIVEAGGIRIGLVHGHDGRGRTTRERALSAFDGERLHAIVFGHSHIPHLEWQGNLLLFNPGSPTDRRREPRFSFGLLKTSGRDGRLRAEHRFYERKR